MDEIIERAQNAFWNVIAIAHPEVTSGDFPPDAALAFDKACKEAVRVWMKED